MNLFKQIWVATDCDITEKLVKNGFANIQIYRRSPMSATDQSPTIDVVLEFLQSHRFSVETIFLLAQATSPFTTAGEFYEGVKMVELCGYDSAISCVRMKKFLWSEEGHPLNYSLNTTNVRRQDFKGFLAASGSFYVSSINQILKTKQLLSGKIGIAEVSIANQVETDEPIDWIVGEAIMKFLMRNMDHK